MDVFLLLYIYRQMYQIRLQRKELVEVNQKLEQLNSKLINTNHIREEYVSVFLELYAAYIDKLDKYHDLVKRKVKTR